MKNKDISNEHSPWKTSRFPHSREGMDELSAKIGTQKKQMHTTKKFKNLSQCCITIKDVARAIRLMSNNPTTLSETMERLDSSLRRIIEKR